MLRYHRQRQLFSSFVYQQNRLAAWLAQSVERLTLIKRSDQKVAGSTPASGYYFFFVFNLNYIVVDMKSQPSTVNKY